jgi:ubiquinone/menaquinone biosynthesis C-methylase UbiE
MKRLNLGCGMDAKKGYVNVDIAKLPRVDIVHDLNKIPWPFKTNEFDEILCKHVLEHLDKIDRAMKELLRILKPGGKLKILVPHFTGKTAFTDPTHKHFFSSETFDYFLKSNRTENRFHYFDFAFGKLINKRIIFGKKYAKWNYLIEYIANRWPNLYEETPLRAFPAIELYVELIK